MHPASPKAIVYSQDNCQACETAKTLLKQQGVQVEERKLSQSGPWTKKTLLEHVPTARSVPQIILGDKHVGGLPELQKLFRNGILDWAW